MTADSSNTLIQCLRLMLRPVIRFCIRRTLSVQDMIESAKIVFIEVAEEELQRKNEKVNVSRLSVLCGLHRRDVMRIYREGRTKDESMAFATRVVGQWLQDKKFCNASGKPRTLSLEGDDSEFRKLVRSISSDVNPGTVLFELERVGAAERVKGGLKLRARAYVPRNNPTEGFKLLAADAEDLMAAVEENVFGEDQEATPNLHAKTEYDNISKAHLPMIREWLYKEGSAFHAKVRNFLAGFDKDMNPKLSQEGGARVAVGTFSRALQEQ